MSKENWLFRFYSAWNKNCSTLIEKEGREAYESLQEAFGGSGARFTEEELRRILSMGKYWEEVSRREEDPEIILTAELNQLVHHIRAQKILLTFLEAVKLQKALHP